MDDALIAFESADGRLIHIKLKDGQAWLSDRSGQVQGEPVDLDPEPSRSYGDTTAWLILPQFRSDEHPSELQSLMRISYAVFCLKNINIHPYSTQLSHSSNTH